MALYVLNKMEALFNGASGGRISASVFCLGTKASLTIVSGHESNSSTWKEKRSNPTPQENRCKAYILQKTESQEKQLTENSTWEPENRLVSTCTHLHKIYILHDCWESLLFDHLKQTSISNPILIILLFHIIRNIFQDKTKFDQLGDVFNLAAKKFIRKWD